MLATFTTQSQVPVQHQTVQVLPAGALSAPPLPQGLAACTPGLGW